MKTIYTYLERGVLGGSKWARISIHFLMALDHKESWDRGLKGIVREFVKF